MSAGKKVTCIFIFLSVYDFRYGEPENFDHMIENIWRLLEDLQELEATQRKSMLGIRQTQFTIEPSFPYRKIKQFYVFLVNKEDYKRLKQEQFQIGMLCRIMDAGSMNAENKANIKNILKLKGVIRQKTMELEADKGGLSRIRFHIYKFIKHASFSKSVLIIILLNTFVMALEGHNQPVWLQSTHKILNYVFTSMFSAEILLKIIGLTISEYLKDPWNLFDCIIVLASIVDIVASGSGAWAALRAFRLLRLIILIRFMPALRHLFEVLCGTMRDIAVCLALLGLVVFIFSLSGKAVFGERLCVDQDNKPCSCTQIHNATANCDCERRNFDSILNASLTVFQVLTTEDWNGVLFSCMSRVNTVLSVVYFVALFFFGNYMLMNLVVASLVQRCMESTARKVELKRLKKLKNRKMTQQLSTNEEVYYTPSTSMNAPSDYCLMTPLSDDNSTTELHEIKSSEQDEQVVFTIIAEIRKYIWIQYIIEKFQKLKDNPIWTDEKKHKRWQYSFFIFPPNNCIRKVCNRLEDSVGFAVFYFVVILLNCITIALDKPRIPHGSVLRMYLDISNVLFVLLFTLEMIIKCISSGVFLNKDSYLMYGWNIVDGLLALIGIGDLLTVTLLLHVRPDAVIHLHRTFKILKCFRPLRLIHRLPNLKLTLESLAHSLKDLGNILLICSVFFLIFGILGVQLFKGTMYSCKGPFAYNVTNRHECESNPNNEWTNAKFHFNNLPKAVLTLFVVSTMDRWVCIMNDVIDAAGIDLQPVQGYSQKRSVYFAVFIILMSFILMNMAVAVLVQSFYHVNAKMKQKAQEIGVQPRGSRLPEIENLSTKLKLRRRIALSSIRNIEVHLAHQQCLKSKIRKIINHKYFAFAIQLLILINLTILATEHFGMSLGWRMANFIADCILLSLFTIESLLKMCGTSMKCYFSNGWNQVAFITTICGFVSILLGHVLPFGSPYMVLCKFLRITRSVRIFELLRSAKGLHSVMKTLQMAVPQVANLGIILALELFIYSAIAVQLFGRIKCIPQYPCEGLSNHHAHFKDFGMALLTMFRIATGDNWSAILMDTKKGGCDWSVECIKNCCTNHAVATMFFVTHVLMTQFILMNVVVAVLMKGFEENEPHQPGAEESISNVVVNADHVQQINDVAFGEIYDFGDTSDESEFFDACDNL